MAHLGKRYPVLFERDLSNWVPGDDARAPKQWKLLTNNPFPFYISGWSNAWYESQVGVADYSDGSVTWKIDGPSGTPSGSRIELTQRFDIPAVTGFLHCKVYSGSTLLLVEDGLAPWIGSYTGGIPGYMDFQLKFATGGLSAGQCWSQSQPVPW